MILAQTLRRANELKELIIPVTNTTRLAWAESEIDEEIWPLRVNEVTVNGVPVIFFMPDYEQQLVIPRLDREMAYA